MQTTHWWWSIKGSKVAKKRHLSRNLKGSIKLYRQSVLFNQTCLYIYIYIYIYIVDCLMRVTYFKEKLSPNEWTGQKCKLYKEGLFYLFNGISTPYGLFNVIIWLIYKCLIVIITIFSMFIALVLNGTFLFINNHLFAHSYMISSIPILNK